MPQSLKDNLAVILTVLSILGALAGFQQHAQHEAIDRDRDRQHIRVLERIIVSEFPAYTAAINWDEK